MIRLSSIFLIGLLYSVNVLSQACSVEKLSSANKLYYLAESSRDNGEEERAIQFFKKSIGECPQYKSWYSLAQLRQGLGLFDSAQSAFVQSIKLASSREGKAEAMAAYAETAFLLGDYPRSYYALRRAMALSDVISSRYSNLSEKIAENLHAKKINRGFEPIDISSDEMERQFSETIKEIVSLLGGDVEEAFETMAQKNYEKYGNDNYKNYHEYLIDILALRKSIEGGDILFESMGLVETVEVLSEQFQKKGENLQQTIQRVNETNLSMEGIGFKGDSLVDSLNNQSIADAVGGLEALKKIAKNYQHKLFLTLTKGGNSIDLLHARVEGQFSMLGVNLNDFESLDQFDAYFLNIKPSLSPEKIIEYLQARKAFELLMKQKQSLSIISSREKDFIDFMSNTFARLDEVNGADLKEETLSKDRLSAYRELARLYLAIGEKLPK